MAAVDEILSARSLYDILGVSFEESDGGSLRKAYLRRSMQCHPDKSGHPRATEAFQKVAEAYDTLSDPSKKRQYDLLTNRGRMPTDSGTPVHVEGLSVKEAFQMFAEAMEQYGREQGIDFERKDTIFDSLASACLYLDGFLHPSEEAEESEEDSRRKEQSRLKGWARNLATVGSIVSTMSQIIKAQQERSMEEKEEDQQRAWVD